jgi:hypothetical protein
MRKRKTKIEQPFTIYAMIDEHSEGGEVCAGQENDSWPSYEPEYITFNITSLLAVNPNKFGMHDISVDFDPQKFLGKLVYLVVVSYTTGSTFGDSSGNPHVEAAFPTRIEAEKVCDKIRKGKYESPRGYLPWVGYFERLDKVEIEGMILS